MEAVAQVFRQAAGDMGALNASHLSCGLGLSMDDAGDLLFLADMDRFDAPDKNGASDFEHAAEQPPSMQAAQKQSSAPLPQAAVLYKAIHKPGAIFWSNSGWA